MICRSAAPARVFGLMTPALFPADPSVGTETGGTERGDRDPTDPSGLNP